MESSSADATGIGTLPDDLLLAALELLKSFDIVVAARVCRHWHALSPLAANGALGKRDELAAKKAPCKLRTLMSLERLEAAVGLQPQHSWRSEWKSLDMEQDVLNGNDPEDEEHYQSGGYCAVAQRLSLPHMGECIRWQVEAGWSLDDADAYTVLFNYARGALRAAISEPSPRFAAAQHALSRALSRAALRCCVSPSFAAPPTYANLLGSWGLASVDPVWNQLLGEDARPGLTFITEGMSGGEVANDETFPNADGVHVPITYDDGDTRWELQRTPVVRLISRPADRTGMHSLVPTSRTAYDVPPLATVTLERIEQPGTWTANGYRVQEMCFSVGVTF